MRDQMLRAEIVGEVRRAMSIVMEQMEEKYVTAKELSQQFSFFTQDWLRRYGHMLPREQVCVFRADGGSQTTNWGYPLHQIQRMVREGVFRKLEYKKAKINKTK